MTIRLNKVTRDFNVGITTVVEFLQKKGHFIEANPNTKITEEQYQLLLDEFDEQRKNNKNNTDNKVQANNIKVVGKIDLSNLNAQTKKNNIVEVINLNTLDNKSSTNTTRKETFLRINLKTYNLLLRIEVLEDIELPPNKQDILFKFKKEYYKDLPTILYNKYSQDLIVSFPFLGRLLIRLLG